MRFSGLAEPTAHWQLRWFGGSTAQLRPAIRMDGCERALFWARDPHTQRPCHDPAVFYPLAHRRRGDRWVLLWLGAELQAGVRSGCASGRIAWSVLSSAVCRPTLSFFFIDAEPHTQNAQKFAWMTFSKKILDSQRYLLVTPR